MFWLLVLGLAALAQEPPTRAAVERPREELVPDALTGTWHPLAPSDREQRIEVLVGELPFYVRGTARARLLDATRPCDRIRVSEPQGRIAIACDERPLALAAPGDHVSYTTEDGIRNDLVMTVEGDRIVQKWVAKDGSRTNVYIPEREHLRLEVTIESPRLPRPLTYTAVYAR